MLRIAGGTVNQIPLDWTNNAQNIIAAIQEAKENRVDILCLPELCITGYGCEDMFLSEWVSAKAWQQLQLIRTHCDGITVAVGLPVRIDGITYNGACLIHDTSIVGITCKQFLARDGVHYEPRWFNPWPAGKQISLQRDGLSIPVGDVRYDLHGIRIGFEICEDGWHVNNRPGYALAAQGIDLILNPSASHFAMGKSQEREATVVLDGSRLFQCAYVFANHLGNEAGRMIYDGDIIIAYKGELIGQNRRLSFRSFQTLYCDIDFKQGAPSGQPKLNDIKERNEELAQAISLGLFDYLRKSRARGFVVSLSGGADSGTCAIAVAEMVKRASSELGWNKFCSVLGLDEKAVQGDWRKAVGALLTCVYQATRFSSAQTFEAARELAQSIGAQFHHWSIDDEVQSYRAKVEAALGRSLTWQSDDIALQNIQARARSPVVWLLANVRGAILLTTSNRSEGDVGYATMDGDTSGSLAPIAGLSKVFLLQWLKWAESHLGHTGLRRINSLEPTAELRPPERNQTDEGDLMPYTVLAHIEALAIRDRKAPREVFEAMKGQYDHDQLKGYIRKFFRLWAINQWKRERFAPSFHLDDMNVDPRTWCRFPILSSGFREELEAL
ncbi:MAG TPA: NAD(+) synthase [Cyclobacteriaceae bacterium]|jgi:NAD+ synthase (glutamine-hydrolysing)